MNWAQQFWKLVLNPSGLIVPKDALGYDYAMIPVITGPVALPHHRSSGARARRAWKRRRASGRG